MARQYVALIRKEENSEYWIDIPDIPGCVSSGATINVAKENFRQAIDFHLEGLNKQERESLPIPRPRVEVLASEQDTFADDYIVEIDTHTH